MFASLFIQSLAHLLRNPRIFGELSAIFGAPRDAAVLWRIKCVQTNYGAVVSVLESNRIREIRSRRSVVKRRKRKTSTKSHHSYKDNDMRRTFCGQETTTLTIPRIRKRFYEIPTRSRSLLPSSLSGALAPV